MFGKKRKIIFVSVLFLLAFATAEIFQDANGSDFNNGQYLGTTHNGSGIVIDGSGLSGNYVSRIFDAGSDSILWNNLTVLKYTPNNSLLITADIQSSIWNSSDKGINWNLLTSDYNGGDGNGADDIAINSTNSILVLNSPAIWVSDNRGSSWNKINSDFNPGSSSGGLAMTIDSNNTVFVVDGSKSVWRSYNSGMSFTEVNVSFNSGGQNPFKIVSNSSSGLFIVDGQSKIWSSIDQGNTWTEVNNDFNGGIGNNGADGMKVNNSNAIYIVDNQKLWVSIDNGLNWNNINDDFNGGVSVSAFSMNIDENNSIYLIDGLEDVYLSTNQGINFTKIASNINAGNTAIKSFYSIFSNSSVTYQIRNCTFSCTNEPYFGPDGSSNSYYSNETSSLNVSGRYLQYKLYFARKDSTVVPILSNVSIYYSLTNTPPNISLTYPLPGNYSNLQTAINYTVFDSNLESCWYSLGNGLVNTTISCGSNVTGLNSGQGTSVWTIYSNDTGGLVSYANVTFIVDSVAPTVSFNVLTLQSGIATNNNSLSIGVSAEDIHFSNTTIYLFNSTGIVSSNTSNSASFNITYHGLNDGIYYYNSTSRDLFNNDNSTETRNLSIDTIAPQLGILSPSENSAFGYNISIPLNYSVIDPNLGSCWYRFDDEVTNKIIPNCGNITFNISNGNHIVYLFANDTLGNIALEDNSFYVQVDAPTITIDSPINSYLNYSLNIALNYTSSDFDLGSCSLILAPDGSAMQTVLNNNPYNGTMSSFFVNLTDNSYLWAISCNDTAGHTATTGNTTFYVDTTRPSVTINSPIGTYSSLANIPLNFNYTDASPVRCFYNITFAATGNTVVGNSELEDCLSSTFTLDTESSYFLWMSVNDSAGNVNNSRNSFTVSIPSGSTGGSGGSSGGGGGRGSISGLASFKISFEELNTLKINRGKSEIVELPITNKGTRFLNNCYIYAKSGISSWISGEDVQSLSPGQTANYIFTINVPINAQTGDYFTNIGINCLEFNETFTYHVEVVGGEFELNVLDSERVGTKLRVNYVIENFASKTKDLVVNYKLINDKNLLVVEGSFESVQILSGEKAEKIGEFELPKNSIGDYILIMEVSDGSDLTQQQQDLRLTNRGISGFAISDNNLRTVAWFGIIVILGFSIFIATKILLRQLAIRRAKEIPNRQFITLTSS